MKTKVCSSTHGCGLRLDVSLFYKHKHKANSYSANCMECTRQRSNNRYVPSVGVTKTCAICKTTYSGKNRHDNFDTYANGKNYFAYCKKEGCKKEYHKRMNKLKREKTLLARDKDREMRLNIFRAKFIDWEITGIFK